MPWNVDPNCVRVESVLIRVEATEGMAAFGNGAGAIRVHRSIVLMPESETRARLALTVRFGALPTNRFLFVTLELPLAAG